MLYLEVHEFFYIQQTLYSFLNHYSVNYLLSVLCIRNGRGRTVTFSLKNETCASWPFAEKNFQVPRQEKWIKDESLSHLERLYSPVAGEENKTDSQKLNLALSEISTVLKNKALCHHERSTGMLMYQGRHPLVRVLIKYIVLVSLSALLPHHKGEDNTQAFNTLSKVVFWIEKYAAPKSSSDLSSNSSRARSHHQNGMSRPFWISPVRGASLRLWHKWCSRQGGIGVPCHPWGSWDDFNNYVTARARKFNRTLSGKPVFMYLFLFF